MYKRQVDDIRKCITSDMKNQGSIWLVGKTKEEMGASLYYRNIGIDVTTDNIDEGTTNKYFSNAAALCRVFLVELRRLLFFSKV